MYNNIYIDRTPYFKYGQRMVCHLWDDKEGHKQFPITPVAYETNPNGKYLSMYGDKLNKVSKFVPSDPTLIESDVPLETRILIDNYVDSDDVATNNNTVYLDIEVESTNGFPDVELANKTVTAISLYDSLSKSYVVLILDESDTLKNKEFDNILIKIYSNEYSLLVDFTNIISQINPTIITGWNSELFDMPYLFNRINKICTSEVTKQLSPIGIVTRNKYTGVVTLAGRSHIDYMNLYKKFTFKVEPSYALNAIGLKVVNIGKVKYSGSLDDLYKNDIQKFIEYSLNDVKIIVALEEKLKYIEQAISLCHKCHVPYSSFQKSSVFIEGAILTYMRREGIVSKNKPLENLQSEDNDSDVGFEGAFVKEPIPGRYAWVYDLDLQSLYPSIIMSLNISPETKREIAVGWNPEEYMKGTLKNVTINGVSYTIDDFVKYLQDMNYSVASNGVMYSLDSIGIIPRILNQWFNERVECRKLEKQYGKDGNAELYNFYHHKQLIIKVLLNSVYGVLGLPSFRFYDKDNASAVTLTGQTVIKTTARIVNNFYKTELGTSELKDYTIYTDTDSVFISAMDLIDKWYPNIDKTNEDQMTAAVLDVASKVQVNLNNIYNTMSKQLFNISNHRFYIKQEVVSKSSFWLAKKRYAQLVINNGGIPCNELEIKGIDVVRSSYPIKFQVFMKQFLLDLLNEVNEKDIGKKILKFEQELKHINFIELAKNTSVKFNSAKGDKQYNPDSRSLFEVEKGSPIQVKAALFYNDLLKLFKLDKKYSKIKNGQKIKWVYLKRNEYGSNAIAFKADDTDPQVLLDFITENIDRKELYDRELKSKLIDFYTVMGWKYPNLIDDVYNHFRK